jgi:hypothetical protein
LGVYCNGLSDEPVPLDNEEKPEEFGVSFLALAMERNAKLTLLKGPRGAGQIIAEARTVGTERLAARRNRAQNGRFGCTL